MPKKKGCARVSASGVQFGIGFQECWAYVILHLLITNFWICVWEVIAHHKHIMCVELKNIKGGRSSLFK